MVIFDYGIDGIQGYFRVLCELTGDVKDFMDGKITCTAKVLYDDDVYGIKELDYDSYLEYTDLLNEGNLECLWKIEMKNIVCIIKNRMMNTQLLTLYMGLSNTTLIIWEEIM